MKGIVHQIGVLLSTTLWVLRDNPVITDLTKKRVHHLTNECANRLHSGARTPLLKMSNAVAVILPFHFDIHCVLTAFVGQKQTAAALQAGAVSRPLKDILFADWPTSFEQMVPVVFQPKYGAKIGLYDQDCGV